MTDQHLPERLRRQAIRIQSFVDLLQEQHLPVPPEQWYAGVLEMLHNEARLLLERTAGKGDQDGAPTAS